MKRNQKVALEIERKEKSVRLQDLDTFKKKVFGMLDKEQSDALEQMARCPLVLVTGAYGTGKSYLVAAWALLALKSKKADKIYITRPVFTKSNEQIGFLKGDLAEKFTPYLMPILQAFETFITKTELDYYISHNIIELIPTMFLRGCNIGKPNCREILITEEIQNLDREGTEKVTSRLSKNGQIILLGDMAQTDCKLSDSGLRDISQFESSRFAKINLTINHRNEIVAELKEFYDAIKKKEGRL